MLSPEEQAEYEAGRANWLERIARLIYEAEVLGGVDHDDLKFGGALRSLLTRFENEWSIKVPEPYCLMEYYEAGPQ